MKSDLARLFGRALALAATAAGLARADESAAASETAPAGNAFIRFIEDDTSAALQTAVTTYENADGVKVDLVGAVHIGDESYYKEFNELFKGYDVLLYELVGKPEEVAPENEENEADDAPAEKEKKPDPKKADMTAKILGGSQIALLELLDLQHQMRHVDYTPANFVHADVSWEKFREMQKEKGENLFTMLQSSMKAQGKLAKEQRKSGIKQPGMRESIAMLAALYKAARGGEATDLKLIMGRQMEQAERLMVHMENDKGGSVIITERNKVALAKFDEQVAAGKKNLGIFYGAGHFPDMEKRLLERGFKLKETKWRTAWDIPKVAEKVEVKEAA
jgi:hypothetical protein